jgi:hypothetical protein
MIPAYFYIYIISLLEMVQLAGFTPHWAYFVVHRLSRPRIRLPTGRVNVERDSMSGVNTELM